MTLTKRLKVYNKFSRLTKQCYFCQPKAPLSVVSTCWNKRIQLLSPPKEKKNSAHFALNSFAIFEMAITSLAGLWF